MDDDVVCGSVKDSDGRAKSALIWARIWPNGSTHPIARGPSVALHQTSNLTLPIDPAATYIARRMIARIVIVTGGSDKHP